MKLSSINHQEVQKILHGIATWERPDVETFLQEVRKILAKKKENKLSKRETELFLIINKAVLTNDEWVMYADLFDKYETEVISKKEQSILDDFMARLEAYGVKRLKALAELAQIRNTSLDQLMQDLGIDNITPDVSKKANT